jgi:glycosyltransferase involved in cell wall biosynthesis
MNRPGLSVIVLQINYIGPADHTGYGCAALQYVKLLLDGGSQVHFQPLLPGPAFGLWYECASVDRLPPVLRGRCSQRLFADAVTILHCVPEYYPSIRQWLRHRGVEGPLLGMTVWETTRIPSHWPALIHQVDGLIVPSEWNREVFLASGINRQIFCVPHVSEFHGRLPAADCVQHLPECLATFDVKNKIVFYNIGTWAPRKGNDLLVSAFLRAFPNRDDVVLLLKTPLTPLARRNSRLRQMLLGLLPSPMRRARKAARTAPQIIAIEDDWTSHEIAALHMLSDCYVSCTRGEGWGMGMYEAAYFGSPVLAPSEGGHRAFLQDQAEYGMVSSRWETIAAFGRDDSYTMDQMWVNTDVGEMAMRMQQYTKERQSFRAQAAQVAESLKQQFSDDTILGSLLLSISETAQQNTNSVQRP